MHTREHNPPHFHVRYGEYRAAVLISSLNIRDGHLPGRIWEYVLEWALLHQAELMLNWNRIVKDKKPPIAIEPLR